MIIHEYLSQDSNYGEVLWMFLLILSLWQILFGEIKRANEVIERGEIEYYEE